MKIKTNESKVRLFNGDCLKKLKDFPENRIRACVCDPPYGLEFMGKEWDYGDEE